MDGKAFRNDLSNNETIAGNAFSTTFTFNAKGRLWTKTHPSVIKETLDYYTYGNMSIITRYYVGGSYMKEVQPYTTNEYTYLGGDAYTAPVVVHNARGVVSYYYLLRDHLGNITHQVNTSNAVVAEFSFDAWGRRRNATNWTYTLDANDKALFADRGFTGHEYLPWYKLYNMNGRLYDPAVGRFLSADPVVQDAGNSQSYYRYSYCLNNPLKYTDPSGYILEQQDMPPDPEQEAAAREFARKFSGSNMGFSQSAGTMPLRKVTKEEAIKMLQDPNFKINSSWTTGIVQHNNEATENKGLDFEYYTKTGVGASIDQDLFGLQLGVTADLWSKKRSFTFNGSDFTSNHSELSSFSASLLVAGFSWEYDYTKNDHFWEFRLFFMVFGSNGYTERISSGDYGAGGQWGYKLDVYPFINSSNYYRPIIPVDNTRIVIPYKIYNL